MLEDVSVENDGLKTELEALGYKLKSAESEIHDLRISAQVQNSLWQEILCFVVCIADPSDPLSSLLAQLTAFRPTKLKQKPGSEQRETFVAVLVKLKPIYLRLVGNNNSLWLLSNPLAACSVQPCLKYHPSFRHSGKWCCNGSHGGFLDPKHNGFTSASSPNSNCKEGMVPEP